MSHNSTPELLILHAVRLLGFANSDAIAVRAETSVTEVARLLDEADGHGWVQHLAFADLDGWSLTDSGRPRTNASSPPNAGSPTPRTRSPPSTATSFPSMRAWSAR